MKNSGSGRVLSTIITVLLVLGFTLGCKQISELVNKRQSQTPPPTKDMPASGGEDSDSALLKKSNLYISECFNKYSNRIVESHNRYASWLVDIEKGPTGKERIIYGLYDVNGDGSDCVKAIEKAKTQDPGLPDTEAAADKYSIALLEVIKQIKNVYKYYDQDDYKDDNFQKGKEAHPNLMKAFKDFKEVNTMFASEVDKLEDQVAQQQLDKYKDDPAKKFEYLVVESGVKSKKVKTLLQSKDYSEISVDELNPLIEDFEKNVEELKSNNSTKTTKDSYIRSAEDFTKASKELMRRIRDKKPFSNSEKSFINSGAGWMVEGSPGKVIKAYNDLIFQRGFLRF